MYLNTKYRQRASTIMLAESLTMSTPDELVKLKNSAG